MKYIHRGTCFLLVLTLAFLVSFSNVRAGLEEDKKEAEKMIESFKSELAAKQGQADEILNQVEKVNQEIERINGQVAELEGQKSTLEANIKSKEDELKKAQEYFDSKKGSVYDRARQAYEVGDVGVLEVLFNAKSLTDFANNQEYYQILRDEDLKKINLVKEERVKLNLQKDQLTQATKALETNIAEVSTKKISLDTEQQKLNAAKSIISEAVAQKSQQLNIQEQELASINEEINVAKEKYAAEIARMQEEEARKQQENKPPVVVPPPNTGGNGETPQPPTPTPTPPPVTTGFAWPVPSSSYVSSEYGWRNLNGVSQFHRGMDIAANANASIVAADTGIVLVSGWSGDGFGNKVVIIHGSGIITLYGHMNSVGVSPGQSVTKGQYIGGVGNTGASFGNHLHFQVSNTGNMYDGVNPRNYL